MTELPVFEGLKEKAPQRARDMANSITISDGTTIYYEDWGRESGQPTMFSHSWPLDADAFEEQMFFQATTDTTTSAMTVVASADTVSHGMAMIWTPMPIILQRCLKNWNWTASRHV